MFLPACHKDACMRSSNITSFCTIGREYGSEFLFYAVLSMRWDDWARYEWAKNVKIRQLFKGKLSLRPKEEQIVNCLEESKESGSKLTRMLRTLKSDHGMGPPKSWLVQETQSMLHKQCYIITTVTHFNLQMNSVTWHTVTLLE